MTRNSSRLNWCKSQDFVQNLINIAISLIVTQNKLLNKAQMKKYFSIYITKFIFQQ